MGKSVIAVVLSVVAALLSANLNTLAHAQGDLVAPGNVAAQNTGNPGEVRISWDAVPGAAYYRIGWVAYSDVQPIIAGGGDWLERFAFIDIQNRDQTQHTITRLTPGVQYAFIVASNSDRYGTPQWPPATGWKFLNLTEAPASYAAIGTASVNVAWDAVPGAAYYRIGWVVYSDVQPIIAAGGDWLEHFAFIDIANRGQTEHTITRLTPGLQYAFIVAGNDGRYGTPQWPEASGWQFMTPSAQQLTGTAADRAALVALYNATGGSNWTNNTNWLSNGTVNEWHGVTTDDDGRVTELNLRENNLSGGISSGLDQLASLERLDLQGNDLTGSIPSELGNLANLERLDLGQNSLTGVLPVQLRALVDLAKLDLDDNLLTGTIPSELGMLTNLENIELSENAFTGCIPAALRTVADNDLVELALPFCGVSPAQAFTTAQLEALFDEIISKTEQREAFSEIKESNIGFSAIEDMKALRSEFVASTTETDLYYALSKLSNARRDSHLRIYPVDGGLTAPNRASCVAAPVHVLPDLSDISGPTFFVAEVGEGLASPEVGDVIVGVNGRSMAEYMNEFAPWIRHSSLQGLYWRMAYELPAQVATVPPSLYSGQLDLTLENSSGQRYDVTLPYNGACGHFGLTAGYPGFVEVMRRENFNVLIDRNRQMILLQWLDFEYSLIQDIIDLMEYAEREQILNYDMIIDVTFSGGGSRGAYAIQRLVDRPFRVTFGNVRLSDLGKARIERYVNQEPDTDAPDIFGLNLSRSWLIDWARTDATEAIRRGDEYTPSVPFKLAHLPKDSDGILQPAPVRFSGEVAIINARTWGGSHLDQFMAMYVDNDLATFIGVPAGGFSNTWEGDEVLHFADTGRPVVAFQWSIGHTIRPNDEILEGNPAQPDEYIPLTRDNFQGYHQILFSRAIGTLNPSIPPPPDPAAQPGQSTTQAPAGDYDADDDGLIEISNLSQLNAVRWDPNGYGQVSDRADRAEYYNAFPGAENGVGCPGAGCKGYELVADLDFDTNGNGQADADDAYWNDGAGWEPMELGSTFDGGGHTLANLYINRANQDAVGLFGSPFQGRIQGVGLISADVTGRNEVGGLVGDGHGLHITDSYVTGTVSGEDGIGGLIGDSFQGTITASYAAADVSGSGSVGGLIGDSHTDAISNSYATGTVVGTEDEVGGLVGDSFSGTITASYATSSVAGDGSVGGLIGDSHTDVISAGYAAGAVVGAGDEVGGLVGDSFSDTITASYATGSVSGDRTVGGLIGDSSSGTISASYAAGAVSGNGDEVGGLIGDGFETTISVSYWDSDTSGQSSSDGGIGKTTVELQSPTRYTSIFATWNMDLDADGSNDDPWDFGTSTQYPALKYQNLSPNNQRGSNNNAASALDATAQESWIYNDNVFVLPVTENLVTGELPLSDYVVGFHQHFEDAFDFLFSISNLDYREDETRRYSGLHISLRNDVTGMGKATFSPSSRWGTADHLKGVLHFTYYEAVRNSPSLHEVFHLWANYVIPSTYSGHWGFSSADGQLGGFDIDQLVDHGSGQYTAGDFWPIANGGNLVPYSPIELYLAGFIPPEDVPDLRAAEDGQFLLNEDGSAARAGNGYRIFTASSIRTYTIEDIIAEHGERIPEASQAQHDFRGAVILLIDENHPASERVLERVSTDVLWFSQASEDASELYNFYEATGGRGTFSMSGLSQFRKSPSS